MPPLEKPPYGSPCNGCGLCCQAMICDVGKVFFPDAQAPCPGLVPLGDGRYGCLPVIEEAKAIERGWEVSPEIAMALGVGHGCDAQLDGEEVDEERRRKFLAGGKY